MDRAALLSQLIEQASSKLSEAANDIPSAEQWKVHMFALIDKISQLKAVPAVPSARSNTSLDPADWPGARATAHQTLASTLDAIESTRDRLVWQPIPADVRSAITDEPCPIDGQSLSDVCDDAFTYVLPYSRGNTHPRFWGWVMGEGTVGGVLADMMTAAININAGGCTHSAVLVERTVIRWMRQLFGFPPADHGGLVVSGTSMATTICLAAARRQVLTTVRQDGIVHGPNLVVYLSTEAHMCVSKALELLGHGSNAMHFVPVDEHFSMNTNELKKAIADDRKNGRTPFCIIGSAGTVNTGAFDNLAELASIARTENLWFHVDGAFGSLIILDPERRHLVDGIEQADSLAFDFHKWLHCPYDAGCVLVRDGTHLLSTFSVHQSYLADTERGCAGDKPWFCDLGVELSRSFRALKVWFVLKEHGTVRLGEKIADNCRQAQYLVSLLEKHEDFIRIVRPVTLNIVNFRLEPKELAALDDESIDTFNNELLTDVQLSGIAVASTTRIHGRLYIRVCIVSHRCVLEDFDLFVEQLLALCQVRLRTSSESRLA